MGHFDTFWAAPHKHNRDFRWPPKIARQHSPYLIGYWARNIFADQRVYHAIDWALLVSEFRSPGILLKIIIVRQKVVVLNNNHPITCQPVLPPSIVLM